mmetsp:Transcript_20414/g.52358  ORF Transcript_20414/g.52358 Transcript_20414/m.52358 type:complete len:173 (+) Transcript_20414:88-606(+)
MQIQDLDNLDVDKYPDLKELQAFYTVMKAGDALYIPGTTQIHMLDVHTYAHAYGDMLQHTNVFLIFHVASHDSSSSLSLSLPIPLILPIRGAVRVCTGTAAAHSLPQPHTRSSEAASTCKCSPPPPSCSSSALLVRGGRRRGGLQPPLSLCASSLPWFGCTLPTWNRAHSAG